MDVPKNWTIIGKKLTTAIKCKDFKRTMALINSIGDIAEKLNHHPDLGIRNYNEVFVSTFTHSANRITQMDYQLANEINDLLDYEARKQHIETVGRG